MNFESDAPLYCVESSERLETICKNNCFALSAVFITSWTDLVRVSSSLPLTVAFKVFGSIVNESFVSCGIDILYLFSKDWNCVFTLSLLNAFSSAASTSPYLDGSSCRIASFGLYEVNVHVLHNLSLGNMQFLFLLLLILVHNKENLYQNIFQKYEH